MIVLRIDGRHVRASSLATIRLLADRFPGEQQLAVRSGNRTLQFGPGWRYDGSSECLAALSEFGVLEPEC